MFRSTTRGDRQAWRIASSLQVRGSERASCIIIAPEYHSRSGVPGHVGAGLGLGLLVVVEQCSFLDRIKEGWGKERER
jgi:hypothetical protein